MKNIGSIDVICGPMYAGKTEELIRRTTRLDYAKQKYLIFKPTIDNRYGDEEVVSHNKKRKNAINLDINKPSELFNYLTPDVRTVVIDEAQFFNEEMIDIVRKLTKAGINVICAGLDLDFRAEPFGIMPQLLALADHITKLSAICSCCGSDATRTQRIIDGRPAYYDDPIVLVGATESYEARCKSCHEVLRHDR